MERKSRFVAPLCYQISEQDRVLIYKNRAPTVSLHSIEEKSLQTYLEDRLVPFFNV